MATTEKNPRLLRRGEVIVVQPPGSADSYEEVVREVDILIHLANGTDVTVPGNQNVTVVNDDSLTEDLRDQIEAMLEDTT
jgi:hypothetical protein